MKTLDEGIKEERKEEKVRAMEAEADLINNLPNVLLVFIISFLSIEEAVRTSVLSDRWKTLWKYSSHLCFDQRQIFKRLIKIYKQNSEPKTHLQRDEHHEIHGICRRRIAPEDDAKLDIIAESSMLITLILDNHIGPLKSCNIQHMYKSCSNGDVVGWMKKLLEKGVVKVAMALECLYDFIKFKNAYFRITRGFLDLPFEIFTSFEVLELNRYWFTTTPSLDLHQVLKTLTLKEVGVASKNFKDILSHCSFLENLTLEKCDFSGDEVNIDSPSLKYFKIYDMIVEKMLVYAANIEVIEIESIISNHKELVFETPKLQVFRAYNDVKKLGQHLATRDVIEICGGIVGHQGSSMGGIFNNLVTLYLDLDLTKIRNAIALSFAIKSCHQLQNLQINNQVNMDYNGGMSDQNDNDCLPYTEVLFWHKREPCWCVTYQLKSFSIKGYTSGEFEVEFVKYLILNGGVIEKISIWFLDDCSWDNVVATNCLLSYPKLSPKLSFDLKPGAKYMRKYGGRFEKWITTLR